MIWMICGQAVKARRIDRVAGVEAIADVVHKTLFVLINQWISVNTLLKQAGATGNECHVTGNAVPLVNAVLDDE